MFDKLFFSSNIEHSLLLNYLQMFFLYIYNIGPKID